MEPTEMPGSNQAARESLAQLLAQMGIRRIICVDDKYARQVTVEALATQSLDLTEEDWDSVFAAESLPYNDDRDVREARVATHMRSLNIHSLHALADAIGQYTSDIRAKDAASEDALSDLLQGFDFRPLALSEWKAQREVLLEDLATIPTLFLFDQDFSHEDRSTITGIELIREALASTRGKEVFCGLLSHTFKSEQEEATLDTAKGDLGVDWDRFVPLSKDRLQDDLMDFVRGIKRTALSVYSNALKVQASEVIKEAHDDAQRRVDAIDIYAFEQIVFRSSYNEGVWEPDTLFRLFGLFHRIASREKARSTLKIGELTNQIRDVSNVDTGSLDRTTGSWAIQRLELYEEGSYINGLHMPVEIGDIFEKINDDGSKKQYMLLAQPCDLMVRRDGSRHPTVVEAILAEIVNQPGNDGTTFELPYFGDDGGSRHVHFRKRHTIPLMILDLCVYRNDGSLHITKTAECPESVIPTWRNHYAMVQEEWRKVFEYRDEILGARAQGHISKNLLTRMVARLVVAAPFKVLASTDANTLILNGSRIARLNQPHAGAALTRFAQYFAREAFEHDFAREQA